MLKDTVGNGYISDTVMLYHNLKQLRWLHIHTGKLERAAADEVPQFEEDEKKHQALQMLQAIPAKNVLVSMKRGYASQQEEVFYFYHILQRFKHVSHW